MSRLEIIKSLKEKHPKLNKLQIEKIIESFFNSITDALKENKFVEIRSFGSFFVKKIKEKYSARNPKTGELIYVPEKKRIRFRISKKFKEYLNK